MTTVVPKVEQIAEELLVGVTGAVAAVALPPILLYLRLSGAVQRLSVIMTKNATKFVSPWVLELHSAGKVIVDDAESAAVSHITLSRSAGLMVVMPATANSLAKAAHGLADDTLSSALLACTQPIVFAPSMNPSMWSSAPVQRNVTLLREMGRTVVEPVPGLEISDVHAGPSGPGVMAPVDAILDAMRQAVHGRPSHGES